MRITEFGINLWHGMQSLNRRSYEKRHKAKLYAVAVYEIIFEFLTQFHDRRHVDFVKSC